MNINIICTLNCKSVCAVIPVANLCGVAAATLIVILKITRIFLCTCTCNFLQCVCVDKLKGQITNSDFILQIIYLGLDNKIFLNKICV